MAKLPEQLLHKLGKAAVTRVQAYLDRVGGSRNIRDDLKYTINKSAQTVNIGTDYYWAGIYHDGRTTAYGNPLLVWFRDIKDDPRFAGFASGSRPRKPTQIRSLTSKEFRDFQRLNRLRREQGRPEVMIVARASGPFKGVPFLEEGLADFGGTAENIAGRELENFYVEDVKKLLQRTRVVIKF